MSMYYFLFSKSINVFIQIIKVRVTKCSLCRNPLIWFISQHSLKNNK